MSPFRPALLLAFLAPLWPSFAAAAPPIGFEERFALAPDRAAALLELIPGTPEFYYYSALQAQNLGQFPEVARLLAEWGARYPQPSEPRALLETRQHFLDYAAQPQSTLDWLQQTRGLSFNHARPSVGTPPQIPTALDPALITWDAFFAQARLQNDQLATLTDSGLRSLFHRHLAKDLSPEARRAVLARLTRPDLPGLADFLLADLQSPQSQGFGEFPLHRSLLLDQLAALLQGRPALLENRAFVETWLARLSPPDGLDPDRDPAVRLAWLERLHSFADTLPPAFNSLKAAILFQRLEFDLTQGRCDPDRLVAYLKLPRPVPYLNPAFRDRADLFQNPVDLAADLSPFTGRGPIGSDDALVRRCLLFLLAQNPDAAAFQPWLEAAFLNALLAEAQLTTHPAAAEQFVALLPPAAYQELRTRTDLDFDPSCRQAWLPADEVSLDLYVKNVPRLLVKLFEINTENVHRSTGAQINTDLDLDGLVANQESAADYPSPPLQRVRRSFAFPQLNGRRGVWIAEFIGGGKSSRALIRKGGLTVLALPTGAGTRLTVLDEQAAPVPSAFALLGSQRFAADSSGHLLLPFSTTPGPQNVIVGDGSGFTTLESIALEGESYTLSLGLHVPRESLLPGRTASALLRPALLCNGRPTALSALENPRLTLTATTLEGIPSTTVFPLKDLSPDAETAISFQVPDRLAKLDFALAGEVKSLLTSQPVPVSAQLAHDLNGFTLSNYTADLQLAPSPSGWRLSELGRTGEPLANRQINLQSLHRDFTSPLATSLRTQPDGSVALGALPGLASLSASNALGLQRQFPLPQDQASLPSEIHLALGEPLRLPWPYPASPADPSLPDGCTILELRRQVPIRAVAEGIALKDGILVVSNLPTGTYSVFVEPKLATLTVRVASGKIVDGHLLNPAQTLELSNPAPLAITGLATALTSPADGSPPAPALAIQIAHPTPDTRVHILVSRFLPAFDAFAALGRDALPSPLALLNAWRPSLYQSARTIGEEYRYVLERRSRTPFAGNLLPRPGLLLNPWAIADTQTETQTAAAGEAAKPMDVQRDNKLALGAEAKDSARFAGAKLKEAASLPRPLDPDLSVLAQPGATAFNLRPDAQGRVTLPAAALGHGQFLRVLAISRDSAAVRDFTLPDQALQTRDLRLQRGLDPAGHFAQQNATTLLQKDTPFPLKDALTATWQNYGHLSSAWDLLFNLNKNPKLAEFAFLRSWPALDPAAKRTLYAKFACHELNFFLSRKDPPFFQSTIRPFLANKRDQTFLDHYLLDRDLTPYLAPLPFSQLNAAEQVLLARRLADPHLAATARRLTDFLNTKPRNPAQEEFSFESALGGRQLTPLAPLKPDGFGLPAESRNRALQDRGAFRGGALEVDKLADAPMDSTALAAPQGLALPPEAAAAPAPAALGGRLERGRRASQEDEALRRLAQEKTALFRQTELTREWAENNYYHVPIAQQNAALIAPNRFWKDYALWDGQAPFLSPHLSEAATHFSESLLALAVLDLPWESQAQPAQAETKDNTLILTPSSPSLLFHQEIKPAQPDPSAAPLLISQNFYREGDRYLEENGEKSDKFITDEFLTGTVYGCQVVVTNPSSSRRKLDVLFQIPVGALPVQRTRTTQSIPVALDPFHTQTLDFHFYFPQAGSFAHYPVHASRDGLVSASAAPSPFTVVDTLSSLDKGSWDYLSQAGSPDEVLAYLEQHNLFQTDLGRTAWRLKDRPFYDRLLALLRSRQFYDPTTFSYSLFHRDIPTLREFLALQPDLPQDPLDSPLLAVDPIERKSFQWLEYSPLVNARAHQLGAQRIILNDKFRTQYSAWLHLLSFRPRFSDEERLGLTAALLLQDRLDEAQTWFRQIDPNHLRERLQYDYLQAWLAFSTEDLPTARRLVAARDPASLPDHWAAKFREVAAQLDEIDGKGPPAARPPDRDATQDRLAAAEPQFTLKIENRAIVLDYRNLREVTVNYYPMDLEFLFSANPFVSQDSSRFRSIRPNQSERIALPPNQTSHSIPLPQAWQNTNVLVEITAVGQTKAAASYANQLDIQISENFGQLQVRHAGDQRPLPRTYIKVFAEINGQPAFYKDGYTDLRGRFDYASLSTADLDHTQRFSILILTPDHGATVREVKPPAR